MMAATMRIRHISGFFINHPTITRASVASANNQSIYSSLERLTKSKINPYRSFSSSKRKNSISDESDQAYFSSSDNPNMEDPNGPKPNERPYAMQFTDSAISDSITYQPIGIANTPFLERHGVPRQPLTEGDRGETSGSITLLPSSPHLEGKVDVARNMLKDLDSFSHVVVLAHLHLNTGWNAQVVPPRLRHLDKEQGKKGLFATRAPHRPNSIGMSVLKIKSVDIEDYTIHFYHTDLINGTPILDIKPYIRQYDSFPTASSGWLDDLQEEDNIIPKQYVKSYHLTGTGQKSSTTVTTNTEHVLKTDVPIKMGGGNSAPQPIEHLLSALVGCTQATALYVGRCMNPRLLIDKLEFDLYGERDERGALERPIEELPNVPSRLQVVRGTIKIFQKGGNSIERDVIELLKEQTEARCPVANMMISSGCRMDVAWIDGTSSEDDAKETQ